MSSGSRGVAVAPTDWAEVLIFEPGVPGGLTFRATDPDAEPFSRLVWDDRDRLWLGHVGSRRWWVLDGTEVTRVQLPEDFQLRDVAGDRALGVVRGPLGVQRIGVLEIPGER